MELYKTECIAAPVSPCIKTKKSAITGTRIKNRILRTLWAAVIITGVLSSFIYSESLAHVMPSYEKLDISYLADNSYGDYSDSDYELIFLQTGLGKAGVDSVSDKTDLIIYQENYFADTEYTCIMSFPLFYEEKHSSDSILLAPLQDGDVLISSCSHILSWRNGHAAIVTDAENGITLEAVVIGINTTAQSIEKWERYPNFIILRLKNSSENERKAIAQSALDYLDDIPYSLTVGIYPFKYCNISEAKSTQCAHLVWLAYAAHGYDIDSNKGPIVTPKDISKSGLFEVVQVYGRNAAVY